MLAVWYLAALLIGFDPPNSLDPQTHFPTAESWFEKYRAGKIQYVHKPTETPASPRNNIQYDELGAGGLLQKAMNELSNAGNSEAAEKLLQIATFRFHSDPRQEKEQFAAQQPWMIRAAAIESLGRIKNPETLHWLTTHVLLGKNQHSFAERAVAAKALGITGHQPALLGVLSALSDDSWEVRAAAADAAGKLGGVRAAKAIAQRLDDDEPSVRTRCLEALSVSYNPKSQNVLESDRARIVGATLSRLKDPDWRVRVAAGDFFSNHPDPEVVPSLIDALRSEKAALGTGKGRKRVFFNLIDSLTQVVGNTISTNDPEAWQSWWEQNQKNFRAATTVQRSDVPIPGIPYYFGIPVRSDRLVFVLDISGSMQDLCEPAVISGSSFSAPLSSKKISKLEWAKQELIATIQKLQPNDRFNVVFFETSVYPVFDTTVPANAENISVAMQRIRNISGGGGTNLFGALELGLRIQNVNSLQPFETDADTLFLLSDGSPSTGLITDTRAISSAIESANRGSRVAIHTIAFGGEVAAIEMMQSLAQQNYGEFRRALGK